MKKILVIGNGDSIFIKDFVSQYVRRGVVVDLLSTGTEQIEDVNLQKTASFGNSRFTPLRVFNYIRDFSKKILELEQEYDAVVIHYVSPLRAIHFNQIRKLSKNVVCVIWGNDFYRVNSILLKNMQNYLYKKIDKIIFTHVATKESFAQAKPFIHTDKMRIACFGLPVLQEIDALKGVPAEKKSQWYDEFGLKENKFNVLVGYNANLAHKQKEIVHQLAHLPKEDIAKLHLVFPLGYGAQSTKKELEDLMAQYGEFSYVMLDKFYNFKDAAKLRLLTDILINVQPSDQFSGTMQETLYAGGYILAGGWLPYSDLTQYTDKIVFANTVDEVSEKLQFMLRNNTKSSFDNTKEIRDFIASVSSWEANMPIWDSILFPLSNHSKSE